MKITCLSDTHNQHERMSWKPEGDLIIFAGDYSSMGYLREFNKFIGWFDSLPYKHKVMINGNHELGFERNPSLFQNLIPDDIIYLENDLVEIEGIRIYGTPYSKRFYNWAYQYDDRGLSGWIPSCDILVSHGPMFGVNDFSGGEHTGSLDLRSEVIRIKPKYFIAGHIHQWYGIKEAQDTTFINCSICDNKNIATNAPINFTY